MPRLFVGAGDEKRVPALNDSGRDGGDLIGSLADPEDDLRETLTNRSMVIDAREADVLERPIAKLCQQALMRLLCLDSTLADGLEERA